MPFQLSRRRICQPLRRNRNVARPQPDKTHSALARIAIPESEIDAYAQQLSGIIDQFQVLNELDTTGIEPTAHAGELRAVMRPDTPAPSLTPEAA